MVICNSSTVLQENTLLHFVYAGQMLRSVGTTPGSKQGVDTLRGAPNSPVAVVYITVQRGNRIYLFSKKFRINYS